MSLIIPPKIAVGFQDREGTYTQKLAYIIYYDHKGVLHKEKSWNQWCDPKIQKEEYENKPTEGFVLNKGIQRYGWSHFSSNRSYIRVYDPRGMEFEITPENLIGILMETTCSKRGIDGKFVYAWEKDRLVLLPCGSEEYQKAVKHTKRQTLSISAKDLKPGCSYTTKQDKDVIYLGRFPWFEWGYGSRKKIHKKVHIFAHPEKPQYDEQFFFKKDTKFLAELNNPDPVQNYADLMNKFDGNIHSAEVTGWSSSPITPEIPIVYHGQKDDPSLWFSLSRHYYAETIDEDNILWWHLNVAIGRDANQRKYISGFFLTPYSMLNLKTLKSSSVSNRRSGLLPEDEVLEKMKRFVDVSLVLSNGKKIRMMSPYSVEE